MTETPSPEDRAPTPESETTDTPAAPSQEDAVAEAAIAADAPGLDSTVDPKPDPGAPSEAEPTPGPDAPTTSHGDPLAAEAIPSEPPAADTPPEPAAETPTQPAAEAPAQATAETPAAETPAPDTAETPVADTPSEPAAEAPAQPPAETPAAETPAQPPAETPAAETPAQPPADTTSPPAAETPAGDSQQPQQQQQQRRPGRPDQPRRRRRLTAAERHRRTFFAKLTELRKQEQAAVGEVEDQQAAEAPPVEAAEAPVAEAEGGGEVQQQPAPQQAPATSPTRSARAQARLVAAIERVGGAEAVLEALQPKRRDDGETMKWSSVCAEQAQGHKPGDPTFTAWVRLAATPVRDVKAIVSPRIRDDRGGRGRGRGRGGFRGGGGGGNYRGGGGRYDRPGGGSAGRGDVEQHGRDGSFRSSVRIVGLEQLEEAARNNEKAQSGDDAPAEGSSGDENLAGRHSS